MLCLWLLVLLWKADSALYLTCGQTGGTVKPWRHVDVDVVVDVWFSGYHSGSRTSVHRAGGTVKPCCCCCCGNQMSLLWSADVQVQLWFRRGPDGSSQQRYAKFEMTFRESRNVIMMARSWCPTLKFMQLLIKSAVIRTRRRLQSIVAPQLGQHGWLYITHGLTENKNKWLPLFVKGPSTQRKI